MLALDRPTRPPVLISPKTVPLAWLPVMVAALLPTSPPTSSLVPLTLPVAEEVAIDPWARPTNPPTLPVPPKPVFVPLTAPLALEVLILASCEMLAFSSAPTRPPTSKKPVLLTAPIALEPVMVEPTASPTRPPILSPDAETAPEAVAFETFEVL